MKRTLVVLAALAGLATTFLGCCLANPDTSLGGSRSVATVGDAGAEVREFFAKNVYGRPVPNTAKMSFELLEQGEAFNGLAERRQYRIVAEAKKGAWTYEALVYLPKDAKRPVPAFVYPNFSGNHSLTSDPAVHCYRGPVHGKPAGRGERASRAPVETILKRGYAFATYCYSAVYSDADSRGDGSGSSIWTIFPSAELPEERLAHPAWCWGGIRVRDLLATMPEIAQDKVAVAGHSRMGKNAILVGVNDTRFALVCANGGGTKWLRHLPNLLYPCWFSKNLREWTRNRKTGVNGAALERLARKSGLPRPPHEQDEYIALIAPRTMLISAADADAPAPVEESRAVYNAAKPRFEAAGGKLFWRVKKGPHSLTHEDWASFLNLADRTFGIASGSS